MDGQYAEITQEVARILELAHRNGALLKVILETAKLPTESKIEICKHLENIPIDFVKTSTGYAEGGATIEDVKLLRQHSPAAVQVKASGGIRTLEQALAFIQAGATRLGTGSTEALMNAARSHWNAPA